MTERRRLPNLSRSGSHRRELAFGLPSAAWGERFESTFADAVQPNSSPRLTGARSIIIWLLIARGYHLYAERTRHSSAETPPAPGRIDRVGDAWESSHDRGAQDALSPTGTESIIRSALSARQPNLHTPVGPRDHGPALVRDYPAAVQEVEVVGRGRSLFVDGSKQVVFVPSM